MKLHDIVRKLPDVRREQINRDPVWADTSGQNLAWPDVQMNREALLAARKRLSLYAAEVLETVVGRYGPQPFDEERLLRDAPAAGHWSGAELRQGLTELRQSGIIFTIRKTWGDRLHFLPRDTFPLWLHVFYPLQISSADLNSRKLINRTGNDKQPLSMSLFGVLSTLYRYNENWTSKGVLPKKLTAKLSSKIRTGENILGEMDLQFAFKDDYPAELALILDMAAAMDWLKETECRYECNLDEMNGWLRLCAEQRETLLIGSFIHRYAMADAAAAHAAAAMLFLKEGIWYPVNGILSWLNRSFVVEYPETNPARQSRRERCETLLDVFTSFGWVEQAMTSDDEAVFRWLLPPTWDAGRSDEPEEPIRIQPGGDIIVTREVRLQTRWKLEQIAQLQSEDRIAVYRLRPESVARALANGWTPGGIVRFLEEAQRGPLPAEILSAITDWTAHAGKLLLEEVTLLRCESDAAADRLAAEPSVAPLLLERIGPRCFIVESGRAAELGRRLGRIGLAPRQEGKKRIKTDNDSSSKHKVRLNEGTASRGLYYDPLSLNHYTLLTEPEEEKELYPGLDKVPVSWTRQFRSYHASTRKEMIERALSWQTPVELRRNSETVLFVPLRLEENIEGWAVLGRLRTNRSEAPVDIRLTPDMWGEMKLLLPGQAGE